MNFQRSFDELLDAILTDWRNQFPDADTSQGSLIFLKSACLASALWGLYKHQEWISAQIFPDSADPANLEHHAWVRGISRTFGETDAALLARVLENIRRPPAGGNKYDYVNWALQIDNVADAYCFPIAQGLGTVDVVVVANETNTGSEIPSSSARSGTVTTVTASKLVDSAAHFDTAGAAVAAGDVVVNTVRGTSTTVVSVDSATELTISDDIFSYAGENYHVYYHCGTSTTTGANKLIDSAADFENATYVIKKGDLVYNTDDGTETDVVSVDSGTQLTLAEDIFTAPGKHYHLKGLIQEVKEHIDDERPVTASRVYVLAPTAVDTDVTMTVTGTLANKTQIALDIAAYMEGLIPGQTLFVSQLMAIAIQNGADNCVISAPAADVTATGYEMLRPGAIDVS